MYHDIISLPANVRLKFDLKGRIPRSSFSNLRSKCGYCKFPPVTKMFYDESFELDPFIR